MGLVRIESTSYSEALREIRERYGDDVRIVHTRVIRRKGLIGVLGATGVEVYVTGRGEYEDWRRHPASLDTVLPPREGSPTRDATGPESAMDLPIPSLSIPPEIARTLGRGEPSAESVPAPTAGARSAGSPNGGTADTGTSAAPPREGGRDGARDAVSSDAVFSDAVSSDAVPSGRVPPDAEPIAAGPRDTGRDVLAALERLSRHVGNVVSERANASAAAPRSGSGGTGRRNSGSPNHPVVLAAKRFLEERGYSTGVAADLLGKLSRRKLPVLRPDEAACRDLARRQLRELVRPKLPPTRPIPRPEGGRRRLISLVGPTGVGKTTTLAKLASMFRITERSKVGFITIDTYRIGAVEQLRRYAEIIQVPLEVVTPGTDLPEAIERLGDAEVIFVDTAGRSQKDADRLHELRDTLAGVGELEVHLCLALNAAPPAILAAAENFRLVNYSRILLTKLDEAYHHGVLLDLFQRAKTPVSYLTCGQEVPDDIRPATLERLEDLLLGDH